MLRTMVDWIWELVSSAHRWGGGDSVWDVTIGCAVGVVLGLPGLTLVHELGHAIAARLRGLPLKSIVVGDADHLTFRAGAVTVRLGRLLGDGDVAGYVELEPTRASARDLIVVALAGPLANLVLAPVFAALALAGPTGGALDIGLRILVAGRVGMAVGHLIHRGTPGTSDPLSDGRLVQLAWGRRDMPGAGWPDASPAPPAPSSADERPSAEPARGFRWPFAVALLLVAVVGVAVGGALALLPLTVLFGGAFLTGAHRSKVW